MKTVSQWFETIENEEVRVRAQHYMESNSIDTQVETLSIAFEHAFDWSATNNGYAYWADIVENHKTDRDREIQAEMDDYGDYDDYESEDDNEW